MSAEALAAASEHDLLMELGNRWGRSEAKHMTRTAAVEAHHQVLYALGRLSDLKIHLEADPDERHVVLEALGVQAMMAALVEYVKTGRGGTSALGDRNER